MSTTMTSVKSSAKDLPVNFAIPDRIDTLVKQITSAAHAGDFEETKAKADTASKLGFKNAANIRYVDYLVDFRATPELAAHYKEAYPMSCFIPWKGFHRIIATMNLWVDSAEHYIGAIPDEQLPYMEVFELEQADQFNRREIPQLLNREFSEGSIGNTDEVIREFSKGAMRFDLLNGEISETIFRKQALEMYRAMRSSVYRQTQSLDEWIYSNEFGITTSLRSKSLETLTSFVNLIEEMNKEAVTDFFVVAPPEAFNTDKDYLTRFRDLSNFQLVQKIPPHDPLVIRFVKGGVLVVAAWGEEAAVLNNINQLLGI